MDGLRKSVHLTEGTCGEHNNSSSSRLRKHDGPSRTCRDRGLDGGAGPMAMRERKPHGGGAPPEQYRAALAFGSFACFLHLCCWAYAKQCCAHLPPPQQVKQEIPQGEREVLENKADAAGRHQSAARFHKNNSPPTWEPPGIARLSARCGPSTFAAHFRIIFFHRRVDFCCFVYCLLFLAVREKEMSSWGGAGGSDPPTEPGSNLDSPVHLWFPWCASGSLEASRSGG